MTLLAFALGLVGGWTSPFLAKLTSPDSELPVTAVEASWIASLIQLGRVVGAVIGSVGVTYLGSKFSVLSIGVPVVVSWTLLALADTVGWIYAARSLQGISTGMFFSTFPMYVGEISSPKIRGALISLLMNAAAIGGLIGNLIGSLTSMSTFSIVSLVPSVAFLVSFALLPASPHYLTSRGRHDEAAEAIAWYQRDADVTAELESLKRFVDSQREATFGDTMRELSLPRNRRAFVLVMIVFMLLQVGGTYSMGYYMEIILRRAGVNTILDPGMAVVGIGIFGITGGFLAMYTNDKFGRKAVLSGSAAGLTITLVILGVHYLLIQEGWGTPGLEWLPVIDLAVFNFFICMGIATVPSTIVSELFPPRIKSIAACAANMTSGLFAFVSTKTYQQMVDVMPDQYVFWFYAAMMAVLGIYTVISLPETKGKSLQEIQDMLARK